MRSMMLAGVMMMLVAAGCAGSSGDPPLPDPAEIETWFDGAADVSIEGDRILIRAEIEPEHLERGGRLWQRATPYFYLFNVHIRQVLLEHPGVGGVDVVIHGNRGDLVSRVSLDRATMSIYEWDRAVAYTSRAQREGTQHPRHLSDLIRWAEDRVDLSEAPALTAQ